MTAVTTRLEIMKSILDSNEMANFLEEMEYFPQRLNDTFGTIEWENAFRVLSGSFSFDKSANGYDYWWNIVKKYKMEEIKYGY